MNKLYIHIGLPKTATTTLQRDFFPYVDNERYDYLGTPQPRVASSEGDSLFWNIYDYIKTGENLAKASEELASRLAVGRDLIISEEMILVSSKGGAWRDKLRRLGELVKGIDYKILLTVREPVSAMFSYYVERLGEMSEPQKNWLHYVLSNEAFDVFRYDVLLDELSVHFKADALCVIPFERLIRGGWAELLSFVETETLSSGFSGLGVSNQKKNQQGSVIVYRRQVERVSRSLSKRVKRTKGIQRWFWAACHNIWSRVKCSKLAWFAVARPTAAEEVDLKEALSSGIKELKNSHNIVY